MGPELTPRRFRRALGKAMSNRFFTESERKLRHLAFQRLEFRLDGHTLMTDDTGNNTSHASHQNGAPGGFLVFRGDGI